MERCLAHGIAQTVPNFALSVANVIRVEKFKIMFVWNS